MNHSDLASLEEQLDSFDAMTRREALGELARRTERKETGLGRVKDEVNLHYHTFFSFNAKGWSPSRIAWEARKYGLAVAGTVDFDVLDAVTEFLEAGEVLKLRTTAAMETRVFINEYADKVINSPNEPGIAYFMAAGCTQEPASDSAAAKSLRILRETARRRNTDVMERVNEHLRVVRLDYDAEVVPLTPSGNATERHLLAAYDAKAREVFPDAASLAAFWAKSLSLDSDDAALLISNPVKLHETMRSKLMKYGGVGYVAPSPETFPSAEMVIEMALQMNALPMATWLDGTNPGEANMPEMLHLLASKGVVAMNIIPDRNWNIKDADEKRTKVENLGRAVAAARDIHFPLCVGTEMNKAGLPFVDDFSAPELVPFVQDFLDGAYFLWGHTCLARNAGIGASSSWAEAHFSGNRAEMNEFYTKAGRLAQPGRGALINIKAACSLEPADVLKLIERAGR